MKKLLLTLAIVAIVQFSYAQFTTSGNHTTTMDNVGIGTTSPASQLELRNGSGLSIIASNARILFGDITNMMNLRMDNASNLQITNSVFSPLVSFMQGGNVGIGTTTPTAKLHISNSYDPFSPTALKLFYQDSWSSPTYASNFRFVDIASTEGGNIFELNGYGVGIGYDPPAFLSQDKLYVNGNVAIGTSDAQGYKLAVNGSAIAESVTVKLHGNWPDYVFKKEYTLPSLAELKKYIDKNEHLPEMPSEQEVKDYGINLGEIVKLQTKKIEELTLYLIEQQAINQSLQKQIDQLVKKQ